jgi:hypothetical protein
VVRRRQQEQPGPEPLGDLGLAGVGHDQHQDHQPDAELDADLHVVDRHVARLEDSDEEQPGEERRAGTVAHRAVDDLVGLAGLHDQATEERGEAEQVHEQEDQPSQVHTRSLVAAGPHFFLALGAGRTTSTGHGA